MLIVEKASKTPTVEGPLSTVLGRTQSISMSVFTSYKTTVTPKINILIMIIVVTVVLYFVKILSGSRNFY